MRIRELKLSCWRNFREADVTFAPGLNFVTGPNGAGKTNLLEAVAYLGQTRSFRRALDRNLITEGEKLASIQGVFEVEGEVYSRTVDIRISTQAKSISVDGKRFKTTSSYFGNVSTISFDPRRVFLFKGEPSERRRAMDEACAAIDGRYLHALSRYKRLLKERNRALAQGLDDDVLAAYSGQLITCAYQLIRQRRALVSSASAKAAPTTSRRSGPRPRACSSSGARSSASGGRPPSVPTWMTWSAASTTIRCRYTGLRARIASPPSPSSWLWTRSSARGGATRPSWSWMTSCPTWIVREGVL